MLNNKTIDRVTGNLIEWSMSSFLWNGRRLIIADEIEEDACLPGVEQSLIDAGFDNPIDKFFESPAARLWRIAELEKFFVSDFGENLGFNVINEYLNDRGDYESSAGRAWLKSLRRSNISLFEIIGIERGKTITLRDMVLDNTTLTVHEYLGSKSFAIWDCLAARIVRVKDKCYLSGTVLPFERKYVKTTIEVVEKHLDQSKRETRKENRKRRRKNLDDLPIDRATLYRNLNLTAIFLNTWLIQNVCKDNTPPTIYQNSDGEKMIPCEVRFPIVGPHGDVIKKLDNTAGFDQCDSVHEWAWLGAGNPTERTANKGKVDLDAEVYPESVERDFSVTKLGNITIEQRSLLLETNSEERARRGASYLSKCMGGLLGHCSAIRHTNKPIAVHSAEDSDNVNIFIPTHLKTKEIHAYLDSHYQVIIDRPTSRLGNKTPRKAAKSILWRDKTIDWLKQLEGNEYRRYQNSNHKLYDTAWIWEELNLKRPV